MQTEYDITIAGGGFAGLKAAERAAEGGSETIVFEQSPEIGYPIHTSGGSFIPDLKRLNIPSEYYHPIEKIVFHAPSEATSFRYETPVMCVIDVRGVRQYLATQAIEAGADILTDTTVTDIIQDDSDRVSGVEVSHDGTQHDISSAVTIDASGFQSVAGKNAGLHDGFERFGRGRELDLYAPEYDATTVHLMVGERLVPSGYAWAFPHGNNRVRVGVGSLYPDTESNLDRSMQKLFEEYGDLGLDKQSQIESHSGVIPSGGKLDKLVEDGIILAGDAASFPFGIVGEGIRIALETGTYSGEVATQAVQANRVNRSGLKTYEEHWQNEYETAFSVSQQINQQLSKLDDEHWNRGTEILSEFSPKEFYQLMRSDFSGRSIARMAIRHPKALIPLLKAFGSAKVQSYSK